MTAEQLKPVFEKKYDRSAWQHILRENFNVSTLLDKPADITSRIRSNPYDAKAWELGNFSTTDGHLVGIYEVAVADNVQIHRNRKGLRNLLAQVYSTDVEAALLVFIQGNKWRFSYVSEITVKNKETGKREKKSTDPKRFTYLLGEGERAKTAADRFARIKKSEDLFGKGVNLTSLEEAFNVEKMSKVFFNEYRKHYGLFTAFLTGEDENGKKICNASPFLQSKFNGDHKKARDFVKKMIGRIVFLYFLEKKGWLGVPDNGSWGDGDENFLSNLFEHSIDKKGFYSNVLVPLFFASLNTERKNDYFKVEDSLFKKSGYSKLKVPYLNGGLFEEDEVYTQFLDFPEELFRNLFTFFDQYNFTVYEDSPDEHTVAVDPEMLGHIFENLLEDNKDKGAFYTPKEIVHYMCRESLIEYLYTKLTLQLSETGGYLSFGEGRGEKLRTAIEKLVLQHEAADIIEYDEAILKALKEVKICDPAIGSGAFPMGLLMEIFHLVETLYDASPDVTGKIWELKKGWNPAQVKENIIQNSIYGVDIEKGAVDIARLRFWLSLVVEEDTPKPLPNLDYKIVVGNSLLSKFEDEVIDIEWVEGISIDTADKKREKLKEILEQLADKQKKYFDAKEEKGKLQHEIRNLKIDILSTQLTLTRRRFEEKNKIQYTLMATDKEKQKREVVLEKLRDYSRAINKLEALKKHQTQPLEFFDWKLDFPEVMNEKVTKGDIGFDILIANPPYLGERKNKSVFYDIQKSKNVKYYLGRMDYFYFFYHLSLDLVKNDGTFTIISTNYFPTALGASKLRADIKERAQILNIINFNEGKVFDSAFGQHNMIMKLKKGKAKVKCITKVVKYCGFLDSGKLVSILSSEINDELKNVTKVEQSNLWDGQENYLRIGGILNESTTINANSIIKKILDKSTDLLGSICSPLIGLESSLDKVYVVGENEISSIIDSDSEKSLFKPFFKNSDVQRYYVGNKTDSYILYLHEEITKIESYRGVWRYLKNHEQAIKNRKGANLRGAYRRGNWWVLNTPRLDMDFNDVKIVTPYRSKTLRFALSTSEWYASRDVYYIVKNRNDINLKYILGLLNSKLYFIWYYNRGKRKGDTLELYAKPLKETPIYLVNKKIQNAIIDLVDKIIENYKMKKLNEAIALENQLDIFIYRMFSLTYEEACFVEGNTDWMSKEEYEQFKIEE